MNNNIILVTIYVVIFVILMIVIGKGMHKDQKMKPKYDERQMAIRGRGYMLAFYSIIVTTCLLPLILTDNMRAFLGDTIFLIPLFVGLPVHVMYCVWNNAYIELNLNAKAWIGYMIFIGAFNIGIGIWAVCDGRMIQDGVLQVNIANLYLGIMLVIIIIEILIKNAIDGKEEDDDEESEA